MSSINSSPSLSSTTTTTTTTTTNKLTSYLYNYINIPSSITLKCSSCQNNQIQRHLQQQLGSGYYHIPDRYVDIYVCGFCKKLHEQKCQYCWQAKPCCGHREKILYKEYFNMVKKQLLSNMSNLIKTVKKYDNNNNINTNNNSRSQLSQHSPTLSSTSSLLFNQLIIQLNTIQQQLKQQIIMNISQNNQKLTNIYNQFQKQLFSKIQPYTPQGIERYRSEKNDKMAIRYVGLGECQNLVKQVETFRRMYEQQAYELSQRYIQRVGQQYPAMLFNKIQQGFRRILTPQITYKSALCQTAPYENFNNTGNNFNLTNTHQIVKSSPEIPTYHQFTQDHSHSMKQLQMKIQQYKRVLQQKQIRISQLQSKLQKLTNLTFLQSSQQKASILKEQQKPQGILTTKTTTTTNITRPRKRSQTGGKQFVQQQQNSRQQQMMNSSWLQDVVNQIGQ